MFNKFQSHQICGHEQMSIRAARAVSTRKEKEEKIETMTDDRNVWYNRVMEGQKWMSRQEWRLGKRRRWWSQLIAFIETYICARNYFY